MGRETLIRKLDKLTAKKERLEEAEEKRQVRSPSAKNWDEFQKKIAVIDCEIQALSEKLEGEMRSPD